MTKRTPQEKKTLSYAKDTRNDYRENDKSSRKNIPRHKARVNRNYRRKVDGILQTIAKVGDIEQVELVADKAVAIKKDAWKKSPDAPLGEFVNQKLELRASHVGKGTTARKRVKEFISNLKIEVEREDDGRWIAEASGEVTAIVYGDSKESAIDECKQVAGNYFLGEIGAGDTLQVSVNRGIVNFSSSINFSSN